jgi:hypothetical protein
MSNGGKMRFNDWTNDQVISIHPGDLREGERILRTHNPKYMDSIAEWSDGPYVATRLAQKIDAYWSIGMKNPVSGNNHNDYLVSDKENLWVIRIEGPLPEEYGEYGL